jgi:hypothetical protein
VLIANFILTLFSSQSLSRPLSAPSPPPLAISSEDCFPEVSLLSTTLFRVTSCSPLIRFHNDSSLVSSCADLVLIERRSQASLGLSLAWPLLRKTKIPSFAWSSLVDPRSFREIGKTKAHTIPDLLR